MRIACWSGPRNISTALMRSWSSRNDSFVSDEPFYAYYLKNKKLKHPMYKEIIQTYPNEYDQIVKNLTSKIIPNNKKVWYQKHMAHHLLDFNNIKWIKKMYNCILIRHPKYVINSYIKKNNLDDISELGYTQQFALFEYLKKNNNPVIVIDSNSLLKNPEKIISIWCEKLDINFDSYMMKWEQGYHINDGIWAKHWYNNVINTTGFQKLPNKIVKIDKKYHGIYEKSLDYYNELFRYSLS